MLTQLPLTVISGYLGAGKTTLINRLLSGDHGLSIMVLVNDFGAINVDETLIAADDGNMIALSNGCVCCTMDADLYAALNNVLDRDPRPDHLVIEASGIADPAAIAAAVGGAPDLGYAGIVTLVDAHNIADLLDDPDTGPSVAQQIRVADMVLVTKTDRIEQDLSNRLTGLGARPPALMPTHGLEDLLFDLVPLPRGRDTTAHPHYVQWSHTSNAVHDRRALGDRLAGRPQGLYRLKGRVQTGDGAYEVHVVGRHTEARRVPGDGQTMLVGLGLAGRLTWQEVEDWWSAPSDLTTDQDHG